MSIWEKLFGKKPKKRRQPRRRVPRKRNNVSPGSKRTKHIRGLDFPYPEVTTGEEWATILHQNLTEKHGKIIQVKVSESGASPEVTFSNGTVYVLDDYGIGYHGTGSYSFAVFLQAAGFRVSKKKVAEMQAPITLKRQGNRSTKSKKKKHSQLELRFIDNGDETVTDTLTDLRWQKKDDGIERNYKDAKRYTKELRLAGYHDWRLPQKEELIELAKVGYKTLEQVFPNIKAERYWANTTRRELDWAQNPDKIAYTVDFDPKSANYATNVTYFRSYDYYVRAVRKAT
jgi:hypothetical protein